MLKKRKKKKRDFQVMTFCSGLKRLNKHTGSLCLYDWSCTINSLIFAAFLASRLTFFFSLPILTSYLVFSCMSYLMNFPVEENGAHKRSQPNIMQAFAVVNIPVTLHLYQHLRVKERAAVEMLSFLRRDE